MLKSSADTNELVCSVKLPEEQPLGDIDAIVEARHVRPSLVISRIILFSIACFRCFVVCSPTALSHTVLKNLFSRFGNLIDVYMLNNKNYGYAKYASKESAAQAISVRFYLLFSLNASLDFLNSFRRCMVRRCAACG